MLLLFLLSMEYSNGTPFIFPPLRLFYGLYSPESFTILNKPTNGISDENLEFFKKIIGEGR